MAAAPKLCCVSPSADVMMMAQTWLVALQHIDNLAREKAFFKGPAPLLLSSLSPDDLTFLLLGSDPKTSQVLRAVTCSRRCPLFCLSNSPCVKQIFAANSHILTSVALRHCQLCNIGPSTTGR